MLHLKRISAGAAPASTVAGPAAADAKTDYIRNILEDFSNFRPDWKNQGKS